MQYEPKLFLQKLKLYFSTLFARSMPKVVFGVPDLQINQFLCSNIKLEQAELYTPDPTYFIHLVTLKDTKFVDDLFEQFALLKQGIVLLYTDKFLSGINKNEGELNDIKLFNRGHLVFVSSIKNRVAVEYECGEIISSYQANRYFDIFNSGAINHNTSSSVTLKERIAVEDKLTILNLGQLFNDFSGEYTCALLNNQSTIAVDDFLKNAKVDNYTHMVLAVREKDAARLNIWFSCPVIEVISTQPAVVWFPKQTKSPIVI